MERDRRVHHPGVRGPGEELELSPEESGHLLRVLRLRRGDSLAVFDGAGREWRATLLDARGTVARIQVEEERTEPVESPLDVVLFQGLCRPERMEWIVQKGTEIGLRAVVPFAAAHSGVPRPGPARMERWRRVAREACKQCGRRRVPDVLDPLPELPPPRSRGLALVLDAGPRSRPLASYLAAPPPPEVHLAVGPEGGFSDAEIEERIAAGWWPAALGPRVLRTETAGIVAAALVMSAWGDLGSRRV